MKTKNTIVMIVMALVSTSAFASEKRLSDDASEVARLLLNRQISAEVQKFAEAASDVESITKQEAHGVTRYLFEAIVIRQGDIACGSATLVITKKLIPGAIFGPGEALTAKVKADLSHCEGL